MPTRGHAFCSNGSFAAKNKTPVRTSGSGLAACNGEDEPPPAPATGPAHPHIHVAASPLPISELDLNKKEHRIMITFAFCCPEVCVPGCERGGGGGQKKAKSKHRQKRAQREGNRNASPHKTALSYRERRAMWRQHQHRLCSRRSAGNYDNNVFPRRLLSDFVSEHLPFLKSPPDNI